MDENPYQAPVEEGAAEAASIPTPGRIRKRLMAAVCFSLGSLFAFIGVFASLQRSTWTIRSLVGLGVVFSVSAGCLAMVWGLLSEKRPPAVIGACLVLLVLAAMFTRVIMRGL